MGDKAYFQVFVGLVPGKPMEELSKTWVYTSKDFEIDNSTQRAEGQLSIFQKKMKAAQDYADSMINPAHVNWVRFDWIWL